MCVQTLMPILHRFLSVLVIVDIFAVEVSDPLKVCLAMLSASMMRFGCDAEVEARVPKGA